MQCSRRCQLGLSLNPRDLTGYYAEGMVIQALNQYDEAVAVFEEGLKQCPNDDMLLHGLESVKMEEKYANQFHDKNAPELKALVLEEFSVDF